MKLDCRFFILFFVLLICVNVYNVQAVTNSSVEIVDKNRERNIPLEIYHPKDLNSGLPIVVINHGYGVKNTEYSFIAEALALQG